MTSFAQAVLNGDQSWAVLIRIEGIGDANGWWTFCTQAPSYADVTFKPWLKEWPSIVSERSDIQGGIPEAGAFTMAIVDVDALLTPLMAVDTDPLTTLSAALAAGTGTTTVNVNDASGIAIGAIIFVGNEAMNVTNKVSNQLTVVRASFGTDALQHYNGDPVALTMPYLRSRKANLYLVPVDANSSADETLFSTIFLDQLAFDDTLNVYRLSGKSGMKWLSRLVPRQTATFKVDRIQHATSRANAQAQQIAGDDLVSYYPAQPFYPLLNVLPWSTTACYALLGEKEVVKANSPDFATNLGIVRAALLQRAQLNTPAEDYNEGAILTAIFAADTVTPNAPAAFRWNPGPQYGGTISTSRGSGTWTPSAHPIDILLCLLTSSYDPSDALELLNYDSNYGNWSSLPAGFGVGLPIALIDLPSFLSIRERTPYWSMANFFYGHKSEAVSDLITREVLRPFGMYLTMNAGKLACVLPRISTKGVAASATVDQSSLFTDRRGEDAYLPRLQVQYSGDNQLSALVFKTRGPNGSTVTTTVVNGDFKGTYGQQGYYAVDEKPVEIQIAASVNSPDFTSMIYDLAEARLYRYQKPSFKVTVETNMSLWAVRPGSTVAVTLNEIPNFKNGLRGWTARGGEVLERQIIVDENGGARMKLVLLIYADVPMGIIGPAAVVTAVSGAGPYTVTVAANRYTDPNNVSGLPINDALAFVNGDVVQLYNLDGSGAAAGFQTVNADPTTSHLQLDGNFGGALVAGTVIRYAERGPSDFASATQAAGFVYTASDTSFLIGASTQKAWRWAEP